MEPVSAHGGQSLEDGYTLYRFPDTRIDILPARWRAARSTVFENLYMAVDTRHVLVTSMMIYEGTTLEIHEKTKFNVGRTETKRTQTLTEKMTNKIYTHYFK